MKIKQLLFLLLFSEVMFSQTLLSEGELAIIGINTGTEDFMFVTFVDLEEGTTIYFTDEEADGDFSMGTGEGTLLFTAAIAIAAGTVIRRNENEAAFTVTSDGNLTLADSGDGLLAYQGSGVGNVTTFLHAIGKTASHIGTFPNGFTNYVITGGDDATYIGTRTGQEPAGYASLINIDALWDTSGSGVDFDTTAFEIATNCIGESFANANLPGSYADGSFTGDNGFQWTYTAVRNANNDANDSGISLPAMMLRGGNYNSQIVSAEGNQGIADFSVKLYKGFTGTGDRQVELLVNGVSQGFSIPFDDFEEHVFTVNGINIAGDVTVTLRAHTNKQIIIDDIIWNCFTGSVPEIAVSANDNQLVTGQTEVSTSDGTDFGVLLPSESETHQFTIANTGTAPLTITNIALSETNGFSIPEFEAFSIAAGSSSDLEITFTASEVGTFSNVITIESDDEDEADFTFTVKAEVYTPLPNMVVRGIVGSNPTIVDGSENPIAINNTLFTSLEFGESQTKTFRIANEEGEVPLEVSQITIENGNGQFEVAATIDEPIAVDAFVDFTITFTPFVSGAQTATVSITSNDTSVSPYTFMIKGTGVCSALLSGSCSPTHGPPGTYVTIASNENLENALVYLNGEEVTIHSNTENSLEVILPTNAETGMLTVELPSACSIEMPFLVLDTMIGGCEYDAADAISNLFISEITDAPSGTLTYVELFNPTENTIDFTITPYILKFFNNGNSTVTSNFQVNTGSVASGETFVVAIGAPEEGDTQCEVAGGSFDTILGDMVNTTLFGINFTEEGHDFIGLYTGLGVLVDAFGVFLDNDWAAAMDLGDKGVNFRRKQTATVPSIAFIESDWHVIDWDDASCDDVDYSNIGVFDFSLGVAPNVVTHPVFLNQCEEEVAVSGLAIEGYSGGNQLQYQWYVLLPESNSWQEVSNDEVYSGSEAHELIIADVLAINGAQYYLEIREGNQTCYKNTRAVKIAIPETRWNGESWDNGAPNSLATIRLDADYQTANNGELTGCNLVIPPGHSFTIAENTSVLVKNRVINEGTAADFVIESGGSLVQENNKENIGEATIKREVAIKKFDYVYWATAASDFLVTALSPNTPTSAIWEWLPTQGIPDYGTWQNTTETMLPGKGYCIRGPSNFSPTEAAEFTGIVTGVPENGIITTNVYRGNYTEDSEPSDNALLTYMDDNWNLLGNPYPSALDLETFFTVNDNLEGAAYLWTHGTDISMENEDPFYGDYTYNYAADDYLVYNQTGTSVPSDFDGKLASGQGFFVALSEEAPATDTVEFNNSMRSVNYDNNQFFRMQEASDSQGRFWLTLEDATAHSVSTLIGYVTGATNEHDRMYDAVAQIGGAATAIYSLNDTKKYSIQGRALPFVASDSVVVGLKIASPGTHSIGIAAADGFFAEEQSVYIEDKVLGVWHLVSQSPYVFTISQTGLVEDRFVLRYMEETLQQETIVAKAEVSIFQSESGCVVTSTSENLEQVLLIDMAGKQVWNQSQNNAKEVLIPDQFAKGIYMVQVTLVNGARVQRKTRF